MDASQFKAPAPQRYPNDFCFPKTTPGVSDSRMRYRYGFPDNNGGLVREVYEAPRVQVVRFFMNKIEPTTRVIEIIRIPWLFPRYRCCLQYDGDCPALFLNLYMNNGFQDVLLGQVAGALGPARTGIDTTVANTNYGSDLVFAWQRNGGVPVQSNGQAQLFIIGTEV